MAVYTLLFCLHSLVLILYFFILYIMVHLPYTYDRLQLGDVFEIGNQARFARDETERGHVKLSSFHQRYL